jgi:hypothetical protein
MPDERLWPPLHYNEWKETCAHLHLMTQIVGKVRLAQTPWVNHSWHVALYVTPRGLTTGSIPHGDRIFDISFDFFAHELQIRTSDRGERRLKLQPQSVASFYDSVVDALRALNVPVTIDDCPNEIPDAMPFTKDDAVRPYDEIYVHRFWRVLIEADRIFNRFRTSFLGKVSPVHLFWGGLDLAVTRFSGRSAPLHPGGIPALPDSVTREAYSHEVSSVGWWPGDAKIAAPAFYTYASPQPPGFADAVVRPAAARFNSQLSQFLLMYDDARAAPSPHQAVLDFCQSTYEGAANLAKWDRAALERPPA